MTDYEKKRQENIKKNNEILASLGLAQVKVKPEPKRKQSSSDASLKKVKMEIMPSRVSLRTRGKAPDGAPVEESPQLEELKSLYPPRMRLKGSIDLTPEQIDQSFLESLRSLNDSKIDLAEHDETSKNKYQEYEIPIPEGTVKVTAGMIYAIDFHPSGEKILAAVGDKSGVLAIWDVSDTLTKIEVNDEESITPIVHTFKPHASPISKIMHSTSNSNKIYTSSYDGSIRAMDICGNAFNEVFTS